MYAKPPKPKPKSKKDSEKQDQSAKTAGKKGAKGKAKKETPPSSKAEPKRFKSSLLTGTAGEGPIKLKLTAIKASPKVSLRFYQQPATPNKIFAVRFHQEHNTVCR